jgi:hypothetical protein
MNQRALIDPPLNERQRSRLGRKDIRQNTPGPLAYDHNDFALAILAPLCSKRQSPLHA